MFFTALFEYQIYPLGLYSLHVQGKVLIQFIHAYKPSDLLILLEREIASLQAACLSPASQAYWSPCLKGYG